MLLVIAMLLKPLFWGDGYQNTKTMNGSGPILSAVSHVADPLAFDPYTIGLVSVAWCLAMFFMRNVGSRSLFGTFFSGGMAFLSCCTIQASPFDLCSTWLEGQFVLACHYMVSEPAGLLISFMLGQTISILLQCFYLGLYDLIDGLCYPTPTLTRHSTLDNDNKTQTSAIVK